MKYKSKRGTVINIPDGLNPKQIAAIKADADAGYGTRAQQTANKLGEKIAAQPAPTAQPTQPEQPAGSTAEAAAEGATGFTPRQQARLDYLLKHRPDDPEVKKLRNLKAASVGTPTDAPAVEDNPKLGADGQPDPGTTGLGDTATSIDNFLEDIFGNIKPLDLSSAPGVLTEADVADQRKSTYESIYRQNTDGLADKRKQELEATKQELAERGIPINFSTDGSDLYSRSTNAVTKRYDDLDLKARDAANIAADQSVTSTINNSKTARDAFLEGATTEYRSKLDAAVTGGNVLSQLMDKYKVDQATAQAILDRKLQEKLGKWDKQTKMAAINKPTGGGGGGAAKAPSEAPGFEIIG